jgi:hypothetical protein
VAFTPKLTAFTPSFFSFPERIFALIKKKERVPEN